MSPNAPPQQSSGTGVADAAPISSEGATPHGLAVHEAVLLLETDHEKGLSSEEAAGRLDRIGPNVLPHLKRAGPLIRFLLQFHNPLLYILLVASAVTFAINEPVDGSVILGVVVAIAIIGFIQESKAEEALEALQRMVRRTATVIRDGEAVTIPTEEIVPGDLLVLNAGEMVGADARLTETRELEIDESTLTGESVPVGKSTEALPGETVIGDRVNLAFSGTLVTRGEGRGVVVATGAETEFGMIHRLIGEAADVSTPLTRKIGRFGKLLTVAILIFAAITYLIGLAQGDDPVELFLAAVALAVAAIPEGLPATITVTLAIGVRWMARRNSIVRRMPAVEALGSTTVICSDKTGTLTENRMTVEAVFAADRRYTMSGSGYGDLTDADLGDAGELPAGEEALRAVLEAGVLCNDASLEGGDEGEPIGDPTEVALLVAARDVGLDGTGLRDERPRIDSIPFESERRFMATVNRDATGDGASFYVKGAVEQLLEMCTERLNDEGEPVPLDPERIRDEAAVLSERGLRVLAFARGEGPGEAGELDRSQDPDGLVFCGLQAMLDPPRPEAVAAVGACHRAGIDVKMVTGDHAGTAVAIARQIGLAPEEVEAERAVMTGAEVAELEPDQLAARAAEAAVFARVSPEQKLRLVEALQGAGEVVAMTGDGINDAPALKQADIGVAMGQTGTEVSREASDMVLADDNFASIEAAVREGRRIFDNLTKFIVFVLPTNLGQALLIVTAIAVGMALPILPVQILWVNLTTAVLLGMALAFERAEPGIMDRPPRSPDRPILTGDLVMRMLLVGGLLLAGSFALFEWARSNGVEIAEARTIAVNVFLIGEAFYLLNCRVLEGSIWRIGWLSNRWVWAGIGTVIALQLLFTYTGPMNTLFDSAPMDPRWWIPIFGVGAVIWGTVGLEKWIRQRARARREAKPAPIPNP